MPFAPDTEYLANDDTGYLAAKFNLCVVVLSTNKKQIVVESFRPSAEIQEFIIIVHLGNHFESVQWHNKFVNHNLTEFLTFMQKNGAIIQGKDEIKPLNEFKFYDNAEAYRAHYALEFNNKEDNYVLRELLKEKNYDQLKGLTDILKKEITAESYIYTEVAKQQMMDLINRPANAALKATIMKEKMQPAVRRSTRNKGGRKKTRRFVF